MQKKNFRDKATRQSAQKSFLELFNSEKGREVLEFLEYIFCDQLEANTNNVYDTYLKLGQAKAIKHIRYMLYLLNTTRGEQNGD